jgi:hypothetical protein
MTVAKLPGYLIKNRAMKAYSEVEVQLHAVLDVALNGDGTNSRSGSLTPPGDTDPCPRLIADWVGSKTGLDTTEKRKIEPDSSAAQPVTCRLTDRGIQT